MTRTHIHLLQVCFITAVVVIGTNCSQHQDALKGRVVAGAPIPEDALNVELEQHHVPGLSIAVVHDGRIDWAKGYGVLEYGKPTRIDTMTLFQAASISKPVSAVAALRMVDSGVLALDEDVNLKLTSWKVPTNGFTKRQPVTLRRLLSHSAGLTMHGVPEFRAGNKVPSLSQILDGTWSGAVDSVRPVYEPGAKFQYSGGGYIVLQVLMTDVSHRAFEMLADELVLQPAGMVSSTFEQPLPPQLHSRAAVGHLPNGTPLGGSWHTLPEQAAGGLWTTPTDLASFMIEVWKSYHGKSDVLLSQKLAREMLTRQIGDFGLGVSLPSTGVFRFQHSGGNAGYRCMMVLSVEAPDGVVIMTNSDSGEQLIWEVFEVIAHAYGWIA
ncbi:MAG: serine hydrolase domain-containing protein [Bacteroidota bacterium]